MKQRQRLSRAWPVLLPFVLVASLLGFGVAELEAQDVEPAYYPAVFSVFPHVGVSTLPAEAKAPVAATGGLRIAMELWMRFTPRFRMAAFMAGRVGVLAVNEQRVCEPVACTGTTDLNVSYMGTGEVGLILGIWGRPYGFAYFGQAHPAEAHHGYDHVKKTWSPTSPNTWGFGGGVTLPIGRVTLQLEARYRRDGRYLAHSNDSMEFVLGFPLWSARW